MCSIFVCVTFFCRYRSNLHRHVCVLQSHVNARMEKESGSHTVRCPLNTLVMRGK